MLFVTVVCYILFYVSSIYPCKCDKTGLYVSCCCHRECLALKSAAGGAASALLLQSRDLYICVQLMKAAVTLPCETSNSGKE